MSKFKYFKLHILVIYLQYTGNERRRNG